MTDGQSPEHPSIGKNGRLEKESLWVDVVMMWLRLEMYSKHAIQIGVGTFVIKFIFVVINMRNFTVTGIYQFIKENKELIIKELTESIPHKSIANYGKDDVFDIVDEDGHWRIQTRENTNGYPRSSQGHCSVHNNDMLYCNGTSRNFGNNVSDVVVSTYEAFVRNEKIKSIIG